ncbi:hypothetical protein EG68_02435 [Paragonimus skrjabini miyazakii]|uniref:C2H2-type domain-containing protein n=1 Tax=Paragonimus skrjabini miyazakii TaxID=59628 RepID=A0A8S9YZ44_9TREM|nr:hypothetical protein EG68_02435 [Paragonimus skrjabini miyazakii]
MSLNKITPPEFLDNLALAHCDYGNPTKTVFPFPSTCNNFSFGHSAQGFQRELTVSAMTANLNWMGGPFHLPVGSIPPPPPPPDILLAALQASNVHRNTTVRTRQPTMDASGSQEYQTDASKLLNQTPVTKDGLSVMAQLWCNLLQLIKRGSQESAKLTIQLPTDLSLKRSTGQSEAANHLVYCKSQGRKAPAQLLRTSATPSVGEHQNQSWTTAFSQPYVFGMTEQNHKTNQADYSWLTAFKIIIDPRLTVCRTSNDNTWCVLCRQIIEQGTCFGPCRLSGNDSTIRHKIDPSTELTTYFMDPTETTRNKYLDPGVKLKWMGFVRGLQKNERFAADHAANLSLVVIPSNENVPLPLMDNQTLDHDDGMTKFTRDQLVWFRAQRHIQPGEELILEVPNPLTHLCLSQSPDCKRPANFDMSVDKRREDNFSSSVHASKLFQSSRLLPPNCQPVEGQPRFFDQHTSKFQSMTTHAWKSPRSEPDIQFPSHIFGYTALEKAMGPTNGATFTKVAFNHIDKLNNSPGITSQSRGDMNKSHITSFSQQSVSSTYKLGAHKPPKTFNNHPLVQGPQNLAEDGLKGQLRPAHKTDLEDSAEGYSCEFCGKMFAYQYYRDKHLKYTRCVDQGNRKFPCKLCSRSFEKRDRLRIHVLHVHEKHRPHKCHLCDKSFSQSSSLNKHLRVHSGERPYKCCYCNKAFTASSILRTHIRQHSGEKPFKCKYCWKPFASHAAHDSHVRRTHMTIPKVLSSATTGKRISRTTAKLQLTWEKQVSRDTAILPTNGVVDQCWSGSSDLWPVNLHSPRLNQHNPKKPV